MDSVGTHMAVGLTDSGSSSPSYIQILPNELLAAIFRAGSLIHRKPSEIQFSDLVCTVNRHWRNVAISTPDIWCDIRISFFRPIEATALWFERSKSCLLNITFYTPMRVISIDQETAFLELVFLHLPRWRRLVIKANRRDEIEEIFLSFRDSQAPRLEEVRVCVRNPDIGQDAVHTNLLTPSLRSVRFQGVCLHCPPPLVGLTFIEFRGFEPTYTAFRDVIAASPSLSHLVLGKIDCILPRDVHDLSMIQVPSLRSLAIRSVFVHATPPCGCLLCVLSTPNLDYLEICGNMVFPNLIQHFQADSNRYSNVRTLRLQSISMSLPYLDVFRALPMVTHLQLINTSDDILASLPNGEPDAENDSGDIRNEGLLWPSLLVITLDIFSTKQATLLREVISNRIVQGAPLSKIRLSRAAWTDYGETQAWFKERVQVEVIDDDEIGSSEDPESDFDSDDSLEYSDDDVGDWDPYEISGDDGYEDYEIDEFEDGDWGLDGVESYQTD